eukprot:CAMPEP_0114422058 /NCGR_PEP_ID=MMETSP0103-20121206/5409_1 /TAXON_ID=37642 ORGANISM="Paraphysomonas imperforata, Strain PA2" /NCGR_SAMPLE_ID=MMETSP0103 /ASSEMBLY_ACC=CAM_ASM_000201 /LENGTH=344 /DNA_ID=CAMNT_0001590621 /DNA_START=1 /DNA_END=1033 /DNA_ORIENTATION=+
MSLESSEKIRKQQKELIVMMQRSTQYTIENSSQASSVGYQASQLNTSMSSFGGTSMTSTTDRSVGFQPTTSTVSFSPSHTSTADEHRDDWLNTQVAPMSMPMGGTQHVPATVLASPAVSAVPKYKATGDQAAPVVQKLTRKVPPKSKKPAVSHGSSTKSGSTATSKGRTTKRVATTAVGNTSSRSGTTNKKVVRKEKSTVSKKSTKIKKGEGTKSVTSQQASLGHPSGASVGSQSSTGVLSFDRIMTTGITGSASPYGRTSSHVLQPSFQIHDHQQHHHQQVNLEQQEPLLQQSSRGKPPRAPVRRPSSANSTDRRSRLRSQEDHPTTRPLRSHSLTSSEPLSW